MGEVFLFLGEILYRGFGKILYRPTLLVIIHIILTQKWASPFPCSKTKSKISFSHGWGQAVITTRRYVLGNGQSEEMRLNCFGLYAINITMLVRIYICILFMYEMTEFVAA